MSDENPKPKKRLAYRHFVVEWGVGGVVKHVSKQKAIKTVCELLQHGEPEVAVYYVWDYDCAEWSSVNRVNEVFLKRVTKEDRIKYLTMPKVDLFG